MVEGMVPDLFHIVPVRHDAALDRVLQDQDTGLCIRVIADVAILGLSQLF
jgi:hypothetical protein